MAQLSVSCWLRRVTFSLLPLQDTKIVASRMAKHVVAKRDAGVGWLTFMLCVVLLILDCCFLAQRLFAPSLYDNADGVDENLDVGGDGHVFHV